MPRINCICDSDEQFTVRNNKHKNYSTGRQCKPKVVEKHFSEISKLSRAEVGQIRPKQETNNWILLATNYDPNMRRLIKKHFLDLHSDNDFKSIFPKNSICTVFKRSRNLKEMLSPSLHTKNKNEKKFYIIQAGHSVIFLEII